VDGERFRLRSSDPSVVDAAVASLGRVDGVADGDASEISLLVREGEGRTRPFHFLYWEGQQLLRSTSTEELIAGAGRVARCWAERSRADLVRLRGRVFVGEGSAMVLSGHRVDAELQTAARRGGWRLLADPVARLTTDALVHIDDGVRLPLSRWLIVDSQQTLIAAATAARRAVTLAVTNRERVGIATVDRLLDAWLSNGTAQVSELTAPSDLATALFGDGVARTPRLP
jgi:hypothetical protein